MAKGKSVSVDKIPVRQTMILADQATNRLFLSHPELGDVAYVIEGSITVETPSGIDTGDDAPPKGAQPLTLVEMNIVARPACPVPASFPRLVSFSMAAGVEAKTSPSGSIDLQGGVATLRVPTMVVIPNADFDGGPISTQVPFEPDEGDAPLDFRTSVDAHFALHKAEEGWKLSGFTDAFALPGGVGVGVDPCFGGCFEIIDGDYCGQILVTVRNATQKPAFTEAMADTILAKINQIWGCSEGQCCINFVKDKYYKTSLVDPIPRVRPFPDPESARDAKNFRRTYGDDISKFKGQPYNIHFIRLFNSSRTNKVVDGVKSAFVPIGGTLSCAVATEDETGTMFSTDVIAALAAVAIGTIFGLASRKKPDPKGVTGPSTVKTNLMFKPTNIAGFKQNFLGNTQLNEDQCNIARRNILVKATKKPCKPMPREKTV